MSRMHFRAIRGEADEPKRRPARSAFCAKGIFAYNSWRILPTVLATPGRDRGPRLPLTHPQRKLTAGGARSGRAARARARVRIAAGAVAMAVLLLWLPKAAWAQNGGALTLPTDQTLPVALVGKPYSGQLHATGGQPPYQWSIDPGSDPPAELKFDSATGTFSGTLTKEGPIYVTVRVQDSSPTPQRANSFLTIMVTAPLRFTTAEIADGIAGHNYIAAIPVAGGVPPYTLRIVSGALPDGLTLPAVAGIRFFQGAPTKQGTFTFTLGASDAENPPATAQQNMTLCVDAPLTMQSGSPLPRGVVGQPYTFQFQASGGVAPLHWALTNSSLPA